MIRLIKAIDRQARSLTVESIYWRDEGLIGGLERCKLWRYDKACEANLHQPGRAPNCLVTHPKAIQAADYVETGLNPTGSPSILRDDRHGNRL